MRKFAFVVLDESDKIVDRYNLDYVDGLSGLGFYLTLNKIETDVEDYITKIVQQKKTLGMTVHHLRGYSAGDYLRLWLAKNIDKCLCLEYNNTEKTVYIEGIVTQCDQTELDEFKVLQHQITFQPLTPSFEIIDGDVTIKVSATGKSYPLKYPYSYGKNLIENNVIENTYIKDIPLIVTLYGAMTNPIVTLRDENDEVYNEVRFSDVDLQEDERIIINSAQKKIWFVDSMGRYSDFYYKLEGGHDSFLRANPLIKSKIGIGLDPNQSGWLSASRRQYRL